jgi:uncharacterized membrane protein
MRAALAAIVLLVLLAAGLPVHAAAPEPPLQGLFTIAGKSVPLPAGDWQVVARNLTSATGSPAKVAVRGAVLVQRAGDRVVAAISIHTNDTPLPRNLPVPADCKRDDVHLAFMVYETGTDASCLWINHILANAPTTTAVDPLWTEAARAMAGALPALWLEAGFWIGDRQNVLDIRYHFVPPGGDDETPATTWTDSTWSPSNVGETGPRSVAIGDLAAWSGGMAPLIDLGLHNRLALYQPVPLPWSGPAADTPPGKALRLRQLDALFAGGGVSAAAYAAQHAILEQEAPPAEISRPDIFVRAGYKTLSYRVLGTLDSFAVNWFMLGTLYSSLALTIVNSAAHGVAYYAHELAWSTAGFRAEKASWSVLPVGLDRQR